jgi:hypothetical protein
VTEHSVDLARESGSVRAGPDSVTVEVADEGHGAVAITAAPGVSGGWGLRVVDDLADAWGSHEGSTRAWFRVHLDDARV